MAVDDSASSTDTRNASVLVSLIVVSPSGLAEIEHDIEAAVRSLNASYSFFEVLLITSSEDEAVRGVIGRLAKCAPQIRALQLESSDDFDRMAMQGYQ
ncbi:hypothetical protein [Pelagibacterium luteolum]|uniref:Uncharacterized protein n=1 Tax=Pelagibacterium luteolum TaxID=440168 RepID=A0A1G7XVF1_9HYPH|nr:hypothetical protein [Pelagibacterium luteolum]SDG88178.1 hypothetical protein SAMN04487974_11125 [Pelagibacterium luteolum]